MIIPALAVSACAATTASPAGPEEAGALALARLLVQTAEQAPERVRAAEPEMAALERALLARPEASADAARHAQPDAGPGAHVQPSGAGPAPDLAGARSVLHGVHLASYRDLDHVRAGWRALQASSSALSGLEARVARADLGERGVYLRLKAGPFDTREAAASACAALQSEGLWCQTLDFSGEALSPDGA
ncbi:MAG: SPOR domain-containing protein [Oceanicaulis sp.]|nr:SPOR domain-containing protein [Oceanicaulis sp.]